MHKLVHILKADQCSLVVEHQGQVCTFRQAGVRDLEHLLKHHPCILKGAKVADKVVGKAAAALMVVGGVEAVYAEVLSRKALPFLEEAQIAYSYGALVDTICEEGDRCKLEAISEPGKTPEETVELLFAHFRQMQTRRAASR